MPHTKFLIRGARLFDGDAVVEVGSVLVEGGKIVAVGERLESPSGTEIIDAQGMTLMPGLIDAHTHAMPPSLEHAILFGVTTELDMFSCPEWMDDQRRQAATRNDLADVRSASVGATVLGGHPSMMIGIVFAGQFPTLASAKDAPAFVATRVAEGADYIKLIIEDGAALGHPSPTLDLEMAAALVSAAHAHGKMAVAHATSVAGFRQAIAAGVDGIVHVFVDRPPTDEIIGAVRDAGVFVVPTLSTMGSLTGELSGEDLAHDGRAQGLVPADWHRNLCRCWQLNSPGKLKHGLDATLALHRARVPILAGTDAAAIGVVGTAHGISLHGELRLLVQAGLTPLEALRSATSMPASHFKLTDRGRLAPGLQADLLLVEGDPTSNIADTLSIRGIWRRGERLDREAKRSGAVPENAISGSRA
ncbi:MAG TPA: amidohydrolase family protein [Candidatus Binataceae bacterium]|nr:amidohydrolase family protein [Candidatus Binataceae bacterium]